MRRSSVYPTLITLTRPTHPVGVGTVGYGGSAQATETVIATHVRASLQFRTTSRDNPVKLPGDVKYQNWRIFFSLPKGAVQVGDVITDDLGRRFKVSGDYWNILGYNVMAEELLA